MGTSIALTETELNKLRDANIRYIVDSTFGNAPSDDKKKLIHTMRSWPKEHLSGLRTLVDTKKYEEARRIMLGWLS